MSGRAKTNGVTMKNFSRLPVRLNVMPRRTIGSKMMDKITAKREYLLRRSLDRESSI
jgi:hypothetical protein